MSISLELKNSNISDFPKSEDHSATEIGWLLPTFAFQVFFLQLLRQNRVYTLLTNRAQVY